MRKSFQIAYWIVLVLFAIAFGHKIETSDQISLIDGVKNTAAILFGVVAGWMAIIYPDELKGLISGTKDAQQSPKFFEAFYISCISLLITICLPPLLRVGDKTLPTNLKPILNVLGMLFILISTSLQVWVLCIVATSTEAFRLNRSVTVKKLAARARFLSRK